MKGMKAYIIGTGTLHNDINLSLHNGQIATLDDPSPQTIWYDSPTYAVLIDHPTEGWILYDLGLSPDCMEAWTPNLRKVQSYFYEEGETLIEGLVRVGLEPKDIEKIIVSHMHNDHIGNIRLFPHAEMWVARAEAEYAFTLVNGNPDRETHGFYAKDDVMAPVKFRHYVDDDCELFPGVRVIMAPGHTPGLMALLLDLESGPVLFTSDSENMQRNWDGQLPGGYWSSLDVVRSTAKLHAVQKEYGARVFFPHDIEQFNSMKKAPEYYE